MKQTTLRLPESLNNKIKTMAKLEDRSYNRQIIYMLKSYIAKNQQNLINEIKTP